MDPGRELLDLGYLARISWRRDVRGSPHVRPEEVGGALGADMQEAVASAVADPRSSTMPPSSLASDGSVLGDLHRSGGRMTNLVMEAPDLPDPPVWASISKEE
jgi:hypothetical protein